MRAALMVRERLRRCSGLVILRASAAEALPALLAGEIATTLLFG